MRFVTCVVLLILSALVHASEKADLVVVKKSEERLYLKKNGATLASFHVAFGAHPLGQKQRQGDERTPEGRYVLDFKNSASGFYKAFHISYPNQSDVVAARKRGEDPGGSIMIHGQKNGWGWLAPLVQLFNWTDGCIALSNSDMDRVWNAVDVKTPIEIDP